MSVSYYERKINYTWPQIYVICNHNSNKKRDFFASILLSRSAQSHLRIQKMLHSPISTHHREKLWQGKKIKRDICVHEERQLFNQWRWRKKRSLLLGLTNSICSSVNDCISPLKTALLVMPNFTWLHHISGEPFCYSFPRESSLFP